MTGMHFHHRGLEMLLWQRIFRRWRLAAGRRVVEGFNGCSDYEGASDQGPVAFLSMQLHFIFLTDVVLNGLRQYTIPLN